MYTCNYILHKSNREIISGLKLIVALAKSTTRDVENNKENNDGYLRNFGHVSGTRIDLII